jgi:hypothetical protein
VNWNFWIGVVENLAGKVIDFFTPAEDHSFHHAMPIITNNLNYDASEQKLREERGNVS